MRCWRSRNWFLRFHQVQSRQGSCVFRSSGGCNEQCWQPAFLYRSCQPGLRRERGAQTLQSQPSKLRPLRIPQLRLVCWQHRPGLCSRSLPVGFDRKLASQPVAEYLQSRAHERDRNCDCLPVQPGDHAACEFLIMQNLIFHISLPKGIKLMNGATLIKDVTFDFISQITPYYSTIDMIRLAAGPTLKKISDITIACQIYRSSNEADLITAARVPLSGLQHTRLIGSRLQYVTALASRDLMLNVVSLLGPGAHVLANFSVDRKADNKQRPALLGRRRTGRHAPRPGQKRPPPEPDHCRVGGRDQPQRGPSASAPGLGSPHAACGPLHAAHAVHRPHALHRLERDGGNGLPGDGAHP